MAAKQKDRCLYQSVGSDSGMALNVNIGKVSSRDMGRKE